MIHANTRTLLAYWESRRGAAPAPARGDITPRDLSAMLRNLFILRRVDADHHVFSLAGTGVCALYRREFRDQNFLSLWSGYDRDHVRALLEGAHAAAAPASAMIEAFTLDGQPLPAEVAFLPLRGADGRADRLLCLYQPVTSLDALRGRPLVRQRLCVARPALRQPGKAVPAPYAPVNLDDFANDR
ncbi:MAG: PAS domain-containing protein [Maricaulaceae bacterium]|nr:PAS domain-containing protein [Maricaulaceae bacterium]